MVQSRESKAESRSAAGVGRTAKPSLLSVLVLEVQPESFGHPVQRAAVDAHDLGGPGAVARRRSPARAGGSGARSRRAAAARRTGGRQDPAASRGSRRQVADVDDRAAAEQHEALDGVLEFADVARPACNAVSASSAAGESRRWRPARLHAFSRNWPTSSGMSARRSRSGGTRIDDDAEAVEQVLAEPLLGHLLLEIDVGGRDHPDVDLGRAAGADRPQLAFLEHAQQLHLQRRRGLADLVEEDRPAVGLLEEPLGVAHRAGERPARRGRTAPTRAGVSVIAPQLTGTNGRLARRPCAWTALATSSLPVPLSPTISTGTDGVGRVGDLLVDLEHRRRAPEQPRRADVARGCAPAGRLARRPAPAPARRSPSPR